MSRLPTFLCLFGLIACGGTGSSSEPNLQSFDDACDATPGCREGRVESTGAEEPVWRALLVRSESGDIEVSRIESVTVDMGDGVPLGRRRGTHLVSLKDAGGTSLDAQLIAFPTEFQMEARGETFGARTVDLAGRSVSTTVFLRAVPGGEMIVVEDDKGAVSTEAMVSEAVTPYVTKLGQASPHCPHALLLDGPADVAWVPESQRGGVSFVEPGPVQRAAVQAAFGLMPRLLCHGVARIAFGEVPDDPGLGGVVSIRSGDFVLINALPFSEEVVAADTKMRMRLLQTIVHEAAHAAEVMLNDEGQNGASFAGNWSFDGRNVAQDTIDHVRLEKSVRSEWLRMQNSFVGLGWARTYAKDIFVFESKEAATQEIAAWSPEQTASNGAMSRYGATYYADDIAEMVAWPIVGPVIREAGIQVENNFLEDSACQRARAYSEGNVPSRYAAIFAKLNFVRDLGMILDEDYDRCVGDSLRLRAETPGMHFWVEDEYRRSFGQGVTAQLGTLNGRRVFEMVAEGEGEFGEESYPATGRLLIDLGSADTEIELISWPRGVYTLAPQQPHSFQLRLDGAQAGNFDVIDGFVLVAESSNDTIAGSVFIRIAMRNQAPIPVPQTFDPPLTIQFRIEN